MNTDAAGYVQAIADGRLADAYDLARAHNPFPSICGRVCSAPCEKACRRGVLDAPIAIRALKRVVCESFGTESDDASRWHHAHGGAPAITRASIGVVGAGPAGLAAAYALRLAGHAVTLYDASAEPGGMLLWGIPAFRLPRDVIRREIAAILSLGIEFVGRCRIGVDRAMEDIRAAHQVVLVTVGCAKGRMLPTPGANLPGVLRALEFLDAFNHGLLSEIAGPVVVIGGGSVAFDAARSAQRLSDASTTGAEGAPRQPAIVHIVAPESIAALPVPAEELHEAALEGIAIHAGTGARRFEGTQHVTGATIAPVARLYDDEGRFRPVLRDGADELLHAGTVILAVGQQSDVSFLDASFALPIAPWGGVSSVQRDGRTTRADVYVAGDVSTGPGDLIDAIASGQRAAASIIADLSDDTSDAAQGHGDVVGAPGSGDTAGIPEPLALERRYWSGYDTIARRPLPVLLPSVRLAGSEVEDVLSLEDARQEASRCLLCDTHIVLDAPRCIACALCVDVCPYGCIALHVDPVADDVPGKTPSRFELTLDETSCIRCGLCIDRCPPHALDLVRV